MCAGAMGCEFNPVVRLPLPHEGVVIAHRMEQIAVHETRVHAVSLAFVPALGTFGLACGLACCLVCSLVCCLTCCLFRSASVMKPKTLAKQPQHPRSLTLSESTRTVRKTSVLRRCSRAIHPAAVVAVLLALGAESNRAVARPATMSLGVFCLLADTWGVVRIESYQIRRLSAR